MARSLKKGAFVNERLLEKVSKMRIGDATAIKTWARDSVITPAMIGFKFAVHNGKTFIDVLAVEDMVGHHLGEFAPTRKFIVHGGKMAKDQAKVAQGKAK